MPGPGGGGHGGGFHGGGGGGFHGGGGGGFHGGGGGFRGGFHGAPPPHHHHHHHGGWGWGFPFFWRPRYYGNGGGGCLGGFLGIMMFPVIFIIIIVSLVGGLFSHRGYDRPSQDIEISTEIIYDEAAFQKYADGEYRRAFGTSTAYEDNILIAFLTDENATEYYCIAWVGDDIQPSINRMFGNENTLFGSTMVNNISGYFGYSLGTGLATVVDTMSENIVNLGLTSSFTCNEEHVQVSSMVINRTSLSFTQETVNRALERFTESTGISMVIVVDDMRNVF